MESTCFTKGCSHPVTEYCLTEKRPVCADCKADLHYSCDLEHIVSAKYLWYQIQGCSKIIDAAVKYYNQYSLENSCPEFKESIASIKTEFNKVKQDTEMKINDNDFLKFKQNEAELNKIRESINNNPSMMKVLSISHQKLIRHKISNYNDHKKEHKELEDEQKIVKEESKSELKDNKVKDLDREDKNPDMAEKKASSSSPSKSSNLVPSQKVDPCKVPQNSVFGSEFELRINENCAAEKRSFLDFEIDCNKNTHIDLMKGYIKSKSKISEKKTFTFWPAKDHLSLLNDFVENCLPYRLCENLIIKNKASSPKISLPELSAVLEKLLETSPRALQFENHPSTARPPPSTSNTVPNT
ncbi:unnamed protein product [Moneuplotes crassus]|uniref:Uncharacterized protein n=1 Tax=Euplotes crassus TaxID=5936 RepID=A0AAD1ULZ2_EUPCR|nr:unnamed protein product [Moneuplotes crassus]